MKPTKVQQIPNTINLVAVAKQNPIQLKILV
jgi:hypothetical protein